MAWNFDLFPPYISKSAQLIKVPESWYSFGEQSTEVWIRGTGFTYNSSGMLTGGVIKSIELVHSDGTVLQTVTMSGAGIATAPFIALTNDAKSIRTQIAGWNVEMQDDGGEVAAFGFLQPLADGTRIEFHITDFVPDAETGTVTRIVHKAANGAVLHEVTGLPQPVVAVAMAMGDSGALYSMMTAGDNVVTGRGTYFNLEGGAGNDTIIYEAAQNGPSGGRVDYESATAAVTVDLDDGSGNDRGFARGGCGRDTLFNIDGISGSQFGDSLTGNANYNDIRGDDGNDTIRGEAGSDWLAGGKGNDSLEGGADDDRLSGGAGNDTLLGGEGLDWADYSEWTLDDEASSPTTGIKVNLSLMGPQSIGGGHGNDMLISIENVQATGLADELVGNSGNNHLMGRAGNDKIDGGTGNDWLDGGTGNDTYSVDSMADHVFESGLAGIDTVRSTVSGYILSANVENLVWAGAGTFAGYGNSANNEITGGAAADTLTGEAGNDSLRGGLGGDTLVGDTLAPFDARSILPAGISFGSGQVTKAAGTNIDSLARALDVSHAFSLAADPDIADATTVPHVSISAMGGGRIDIYRVDISRAGATLVADMDYGFGHNTPDGNAPMITILNASGTPVSSGWSNDDQDGAGGSTGFSDPFISYTAHTPGTYYIQVSNNDWGNPPSTSNVVPTGATYELQISVIGEIVSFDDKLYGDGGNDTLLGNQGNDQLYGGNDDDRLDGGSGADTMAGGTGGDTYVVDDARDVVTEFGGQGVDKIESSINTTLAANVENLALLGIGNINGIGNGLANDITDNAGNNVLNGGLGADIIRLGAGRDAVLFNTALGSGNVDAVVGFNVADDHVKLEDAVFRTVGPANAWLASAAFWSGPAAHDATDRIIYDRTTGALYYDADGTGSAAQVQFATLTPGLILTAQDFWVG